MILHIDMDAFYASVEQRDRPELAGKPVIVGGDPQRRGVVSAASYEARQYGVHSAMPSATARRLCPHAVFLRPRIDHYAGVSRQIHEIFFRYTPLVEPLSLDEAFLDVRGSVDLFGSAEQIGRCIKSEIRERLRLVASVGVAPNKFVAKIASDVDKPDGFVVVEPERLESFLDPLPVSRIWGVGRVSERTLENLNVRTIGQLRRLTEAMLVERLGAAGRHFWQLAHGIDARPVVPDHEAKSISHETTFALDIADRETLQACMIDLTEQVAHRLRRHRLLGRTVQIKVRLADFRTLVRHQTLSSPTHNTQRLLETAIGLLATRMPSPLPPVRLLGVGVTGLQRGDVRQKQLFDQEEQQRDDRLDMTTDQINLRFGRGTIGRAASLQKPQQQQSWPQPEG